MFNKNHVHVFVRLFACLCFACTSTQVEFKGLRLPAHAVPGDYLLTIKDVSVDPSANPTRLLPSLLEPRLAANKGAQHKQPPPNLKQPPALTSGAVAQGQPPAAAKVEAKVEAKAEANQIADTCGYLLKTLPPLTLLLTVTQPEGQLEF